MEPILIARRKPQDHANGAPGRWWAEYRVRELPDTERNELFRRLDRTDRFVLESRYCHTENSEYCTGEQTHTGKWEAWDYGQTAEAAALSCCGDSSYMEAESLHPLHALVLAEGEKREARGKRIAELRELTHVTSNVRGFGFSTVEIDVEADEKERAEAEFERQCKEHRIWSKVQQGQANPVLLAQIKERVIAEYRVRLAQRQKEHAAAMRELRELESVVD